MNLPRRLPPKDAILSKVEYDTNGGCWLWLGYITKLGYAQYSQSRASHISYVAFVGPMEIGAVICHRCDVPACVNPDHLFQGSQMDNIRDAKKKGRNAIGIRHARAKLTEDMVREIRASKGMHTRISRRYPVTASAVRDIRNGITWKHVQ